MIIDMNSSFSTEGGAITFPEWTFPPQANQGPSATGPVNKEVVILRGTNVNTIRGGAIVNDPE